MEIKIRASKDATINVPQLEIFIERIQDKLPNLDYDGKRLALDMLDIKVWVDDESVEVTGIIDSEHAIVTSQSGASS